MAKNKIEVQFARQPRYYKDFSCIGGKCPLSCCLGWRVDWAKEEVEKLRDAECSDDLKAVIESSFDDIGDRYVVKLDSKGRCPFLTEDHLCSIQRELGEEYLSYVCRSYPRNHMLSGNAIFNSCHISCCHVLDILCNDKDCMILENYKPSKSYERLSKDEYTDVINHPELKYRQELFEFFYEIISDDSHSLETSIVLGALAAQGLTRIINNGEYDNIPNFIKDLKKQLGDPEQIEKLESFKPKPEVRATFGIAMSQSVFGIGMHNFIIEDGNVNVEKFLHGEKVFNEAYSDRPFALRNIALNLMLELKMPFRDKNVSLFENYCYFAAAVSSVKFAAAAMCTERNNSDMGFKTVSAYISRSFAHTDIKVKQIIDLLNKFHCTSPAYLLLILK